MNPANKTIWITGASSGIGEVLTYKLIQEAATLIISSENESELKRVKDNCVRDYNIEPKIVVLDLSKNSTIQPVVLNVIREYKKIDILFNNAGISQRSMVNETTSETERLIMEIDYFGAVTLARLLLPYMLAQKSGHFVITSSISGKFGFPLRSSYSAAKHALCGYFESLRAEYEDQGIKVTLIFPGRVRTNISKNAVLGDGSRHNIMDHGQSEGVTPEFCAEKMIQGMIRNRKEVLIGGKEILMVYFKRYLPALFYKIVSKVKPT
jgi:dehydrogenase/reductase SDR family member 7B